MARGRRKARAARAMAVGGPLPALLFLLACVHYNGMSTVVTISPDEIRAIRKALGLSQTDLADLLGMTRDAVAQWETDRCRPNGAAVTLLRQLEAKAKSRLTS